ncbi:MAG TPA: hypothetical protein VJA23_03625 [Candidatus Nanoarchaeia archaeon]|nr:hypothetical protein [Candidatus Nanoarchaeia archaeon]
MWKNLLNKVKWKITELKQKREFKRKIKTEKIIQKNEEKEKKIEEKSKAVVVESKKITESGAVNQSINTRYSNRFLKFYYLNQNKLNKERRKSYSYRKGKGICVRCKQKSLPGIIFCEFHQQKQQTYNYRSRHKSV